MKLIRVKIYLLFISLLHVFSCDDNMKTFEPSFRKLLIQGDIKDGYWIETFKPDDQTPVGFLTSGVTKGEIRYFQSPYNNLTNNQSILIEKLITPIALDKADISGDGFEDIIACFDYGNTILDFNINGGHIAWFENPGTMNSTKPWKQHYVGKSATMHRIKVGHFTQNQRWEIIGLPVVNGPFDVPVPVLLFRQPENVLVASEWDCEPISTDYFHIIHDVVRFTVNSTDHVLIASREGVHWVHYDQSSQKWSIEQIDQGEQRYKEQTKYYGSGGVAIGKNGNDNFAYIVTFEPFHGNVVVAYTKGTNNSLSQIKWNRNVLDVYGYPDQNGEGPAHYVTCGDFDNDGNDEFLVALRGPVPNQGVFYYKPIDLSRGLYSRWQVSQESAARIAVADFNYDGYLDFATIGYYVPGYYTPEGAGIYVYYNEAIEKIQETIPQIDVTKQNDGLLFTLPRTDQISQYQAVPFLKIDDITLSVEVIPPFSSRHAGSNTFIKVLSGTITWLEPTNQSQTTVNRSRTSLCAPRRACSMAIRSYNQRITTGNMGAIVLIFELPENVSDAPRINNIRSATIENVLPDYLSDDIRAMNFNFIKVEELDWGKDKFKGVEFYNMRGFNISFADNNENLCYIQLWAAGTGVSAGVHNHRNDKFCEVHACLVNGNGNSGMYYLNSSSDPYDPLTTTDDQFIKLILPSFYEHGPLWDVDANGEPVLRSDGTVVYPWHKWQAGNNSMSNKQYENNKILKTLRQKGACGSSNISYDVWAAIEFNNQLARYTD